VQFLGLDFLLKFGFDLLGIFGVFWFVVLSFGRNWFVGGFFGFGMFDLGGIWCL
jgi:hypothetical protein